ncbi:FAD/NAD(P)-binding domain-containing protein [Colletotrichum eremochloae]|nr:FAD/NAD(P)-binding domain-containing protein [Colletotrichum eremochloae]
MSTTTTFATDGYATNGVPRDPVYEIPDIVLRNPSTRRMRILSIGAGVTGIMNAYYIQKQMRNVEHVIYDKNEDLEGVWFENRYPGCACDVPSHAYTLPFALNPDWPRFYSSGSEIWAYVKKVCDVFDLTKHMRFKHRVIGCYWQQDTDSWLVKTRRALPDGSTYAFEDHCTVLLYGPGLLNNFWLPDIEGLDTFGGKVMHTAAWPEDYSAACKRPNPGDPYMRVQCVGALYARRQGHPHIPAVIGADGTQCEVDAIICAMGFDVSFRPRFPIVGKDGVDLTAKWKDCPEGYMGIAVPDFPNLFTFQGPNSPIMTRIQTEFICGITPHQAAADDFNTHCSEWARHNVWSEDCGGWFKHPKTGRLNAIWPGSSLHYMDTIGLPRYEDYDITYLGPGKKNRFAYLGMGTARVTVEKGDQSPYLAIDKMDSRWLKTSGIDVEKILEHRTEAAMRKWRQEMQDNGQDVKVEIEGEDVRV